MKLFFALLLCISCTTHACNCNQNFEYYTHDTVDELYEDIQQYCITDIDYALQLHDRAKVVDPNFPAFTYLEDGTIMFRNVPPGENQEVLIREFTEIMLHFKICEEGGDVEFTPSGIHVTPTNCKKKVLKKGDKVYWCQDNCDSLAQALSFTCSLLKSKYCVATCMMAVESLRRGCKQCCQDGGFMNRCFWPLMDYLPICACPSDIWN